MMRNIISATMIPMAVKSTGTFSVIKRYKVRIKIADTIQTDMASPKLLGMLQDK
jgi:hypothetical protein